MHFTNSWKTQDENDMQNQRQVEMHDYFMNNFIICAKF